MQGQKSHSFKLFLWKNIFVVTASFVASFLGEFGFYDLGWGKSVGCICTDTFCISMEARNEGEGI